MKILLFIFSILLFAPQVSAQEMQPEQEETVYKRTIFLQTDLEEPVANETIVCQEMPKKLGLIELDEITTHETTTDNSGKAVLGVLDNKDKMFTCTKKDITSSDNCWYFPYSTISFDIYDEEEKNEPLYIIGQKSPNTCNKEFTEQEIEEGAVLAMLPEGTAAPFTNKNAYPELPTPLPTVELENQDGQELTFWQWVIQKIKSIF